MLERITEPVRITTDTTRKCNLNCWYCHSASGPFYKGPELTGKDIQNVFEGAEKSKTFDITLTGGEPMLWNGLEETMSASKDLDFPALQLITNATLLNKKRLSVLKSGNLKRICVSLDGLRDTHEINRGPKSFDKTIAGIQSLREVVDNVTVISVVDAANFDKWPELTYRLIDMGVKQHHLCPVCFAGRAMERYKGLTEKQFSDVRSKVDHLAPTLPKDFKLVFNDILIGPPSVRSLSITAFVERYKGWHFAIRPNGEVNALVRAWGRSWRENETLGNIKEEKMADLIERTKTQREAVVKSQFDHQEELSRKYHLSNPDKIAIESDRADVRAVESGLAEPIYTQLTNSETKDEAEKYDDIFLLPLPDTFESIRKSMEANPNRFKSRKEKNFGFLFDSETFNITLLTKEEVDNL